MVQEDHSLLNATKTWLTFPDRSVMVIDDRRNRAPAISASTAFRRHVSASAFRGGEPHVSFSQLIA